MSLTKESITYGFAFIGFSALVCYVSNKSKRSSSMAEYTIVAKITKITSDSVFIKGVGKFCYEDSNKKQWNLLEGTNNSAQPTLINTDTSFSIGINEKISLSLLSQALFHQKPLKLHIQNEGTKDGLKYKITAVEMP